mmetsp:Transcript_16506/g.42843  ORF Transcript_16506/g.42843 Transcript_16506/m.42843 type:complete len:264 (+) Transcript_16506:38-829(+)
MGRKDGLPGAMLNKAVELAAEEYPEIKRGGAPMAVADVVSEQRPKPAREVAQSKASMADAMSRILGKDVSASAGGPILAKGAADRAEDKALLRAQRLERKRRREARETGHDVDLEDTSFDFEVKLRRIATRGAVVLFNAVRKQQKAEGGEGGATGSKATGAAGTGTGKGTGPASLDKKAFLTKLTEKSRAAIAKGVGSAAAATTGDAPVARGAGWLRDGYMLGKASQWASDEDEDDEEAAADADRSNAASEDEKTSEDDSDDE